MKTTQTDRYSREPRRNSLANREGRTIEDFWIRQPTAALLIVYFIMVVGVGCILELEGRAFTRNAAPSTPATATETDFMPVAARLAEDSARPQGPTRSSYE